MATYSVWIVSPQGYVHSRCFEEVALGLNDALLALGHTSKIVTSADRIEGQAIVLGANLLAVFKIEPPPSAILYNLEQISSESSWLSRDYLELLRRHRVWDYSARNIAGLARLGIRAVLCGIGYVPALTRIPSTTNKDIDVLFIGSINDRRYSALQRMRDLGLGVVVGGGAGGLYGSERDALFARSRVALNLHFYEAQVLEIVRISYLLANRICVVSETGHDLALEAPLANGVAFAPYEKLGEVCLALIKDEFARRTLAQCGFERFSAISQVELLKSALAATAGSAVANP